MIYSRIYPNRLPKATAHKELHRFQNNGQYIGRAQFKGQDAIIAYDHAKKQTLIYTRGQIINDFDKRFQFSRLLAGLSPKENTQTDIFSSTATGITAFHATIVDGGDIDNGAVLSGRSVAVNDIVQYNDNSCIYNQLSYQSRINILCEIFNVTVNTLTDEPLMADFEGNLMKSDSMFCAPVASEVYLSTPLPMMLDTITSPIDYYLYKMGSITAIDGLCVFKPSQTLNRIDSPDYAWAMNYFKPIYV